MGYAKVRWRAGVPFEARESGATGGERGRGQEKKQMHFDLRTVATHGHSTSITNLVVYRCGKLQVRLRGRSALLYRLPGWGS
jgi:hypothetical protein